VVSLLSPPPFYFPPACGGKVKGHFSFVKFVAIPSLYFLALDGRGLR